MSRLPWSPSRIVAVLGVVLLLLAPFSLDSFWLQAGLFAMAATISAIGLTLLVGTAGQLSLGHAFFVAVGAYGYCFFAGDPADGLAGLNLPPVLAAVAAVLLAGVAGALFSPISGRLRGIYLGLASLGLVFLGQHVLFNATSLTGGYIGRNAEKFSLLGFSFSNTDPDLVLAGVRFGEQERLWYLGVLLVAMAWWCARNIVRSRPGRAMATVRDSEPAAGTMGVSIVQYKAASFILSSMYAGLGGVLMALAFSRIVPESFGLLMSVDFLVMIVLGGVGSVGGAVIGAAFVTMLPLVLNRYSDVLPFLASPGSSGGFTAADISRLLYGAAIVLVLLFAPDGISGLFRRLTRRRTPGGPAPTNATHDQPHSQSSEMKEPVT